MSNIDELLIREIECLQKNNTAYWDFNEAKKEHIHKLLTYPATMVPEMQSKLLELIISLDPSINNILDPFMGSGTILVEGILRGLKVSGIDINPLAYLLCDTKTSYIDTQTLEKYKKKVFNRLDQVDQMENIKEVEFTNVKKWYKDDIIKYLSYIKNEILEIEKITVRRFFWICFCSILIESNNSRKSTFKLHIKPQEQIDNFKYDVIKKFKKCVENNIDRYIEYINLLGNKSSKQKEMLNGHKLYYGNTIKILKDKRSFKTESIDLIVTSPPYGDNHTTVTYGQFSNLPLRWVELKDIHLNVSKKMVEKITSIDKESLGGRNYILTDIESSNILERSKTLADIYKELLNENEVEKAKKIASFTIDFESAFIEMARVLKQDGYMILTVGNRRVHNKVIELNKIIYELSEVYNLKVIYECTRNISNKRIPSKVSTIKNNGAVSSIKKEYIIIIRKTK